MTISSVALVILLAAPAKPPGPSLDPMAGAAQGTITFTHRDLSDRMTDTTTVVVSGFWRMPGGERSGGVGCGAGRAKLTNPLTYGGMKGTLTYQRDFVDNLKTDTSHLNDEDLKTLKKEMRRSRVKALRAVTISPDQNNHSQVALPENQFAMLGCLYLDEKNKKFVFDHAMFTTRGNWMEPGDLDRAWWNEFGESLPPLAMRHGDTIDSGFDFEGNYDPAQPVITGTFRDKRVDQDDALTHGQDGHQHRESVVSYRFNLKPTEGDVGVEGPQCVCGGHDPIFTSHGPAGAVFEKWTVEPDSAPGLKKVSSTLNPPELILHGDPKTTPMIRVTAEWKVAGKTVKSDPKELRFCSVEKPRFAGMTATTRHGSDVLMEGGGVRLRTKTIAWAEGREVSDELSWTISRDALFSEQKQDQKAWEFHAPKLPEKNDDFGVRQVVASYEKTGCACHSEPFEVRLFFEAKAKDNPEGKLPNWAYYWRQTSAGKGYPFEYSPVVPTTAACGANLGAVGPQATEIGRYDMCQDRIFVSDNVLKVAARVMQGMPDPWGIDCFAVVVRHESQHQKELVGWWGKKVAQYDRLFDTDGDWVPNSVEGATPPCSKLSPKSCPGRPDPDFPDIEMTAYQVGWSWPLGSADAEDWSDQTNKWLQ